ncbi:stage III sporulation protein AD [Saliterribacillus persicus]|uniref:Stage III sporulation protein AD n=1 Tax=Saliterribacillus persicus TaxID=930114 RepID=A0A368XBR0_9BACI|nr:stage III sporulation protein AD [Saliterribacillus persicus]RCW65402.1 stage III sporulation protein AD [Saliterribacillus persicus]
MNMLEIVGLAIIASILVLLLKDQQPTIAFLLVIVTVIYLLSIFMSYIKEIILLIQYLGEKAGVNDSYLTVIIKVIGIAYIAEIGATIVRDAGLESIAAKVEILGKILILLLAIPIFKTLIETIINFFSI